MIFDRALNWHALTDYILVLLRLNILCPLPLDALCAMFHQVLPFCRPINPVHQVPGPTIMWLIFEGSDAFLLAGRRAYSHAHGHLEGYNFVMICAHLCIVCCMHVLRCRSVRTVSTKLEPATTQLTFSVVVERLRLHQMRYTLLTTSDAAEWLFAP